MDNRTARDPFLFEWQVDQDGYELVHVDGAPGSLLSEASYDVIRRLGGPLRFYRPLTERPDLWRQFIDACTSRAGMLDFVGEFGLLSYWTAPDWDNADEIVRTAETIRQVAAKLDTGDRTAAADLLMLQPPQVAEMIYWVERTARFETRLVPRDLRSALLHQTALAITGDQQWRHCRNHGCPRWFQLGPGRATIRREFCSDRCRVASARRHKGEL